MATVLPANLQGAGSASITSTVAVVTKASETTEPFTPKVSIEDLDGIIGLKEAKYDYSSAGILRGLKQATKLLTKEGSVTRDELLSLAGRLQTFPSNSQWLNITCELQYEPESAKTREFLTVLYEDLYKQAKAAGAL